MRYFITPILSAVFIMLLWLVLVGQRLDARWLGGSGREVPCLATSIAHPEQTISRSESMSTEVAQFAKYQLCDGTLLYLDANTQVRLREYKNPDPLASQNTQLDLIQGRVIVDGLADVRARNTVVSVSGAGCEIVHYSWLDKVDVTPLVEAGCKIQNLPGQLVTRKTSRINTFNSLIETSSPFEPTSSSARDFYTWTGLQLEALP